MHKAKAWLHAQGHIATSGRGRPPKMSQKDGREITTILLEAQKSGVQFSDWPKGKVEVTKTQDKKTGAESTTVKVKRDPSQSNEKVVQDLMPYLYPEDEFKAIEISNGKRVERSMRSACNNCRVSLVVCTCGQPRICSRDGRGSVRVDIERR